MPNARNTAWGGTGGDGVYTPPNQLVQSGDISDGTIVNVDIAAAAAIAGSKLADGGVTNAKLVAAAGVLADMPPGRELTYNEFTSPVSITATTDATAQTVVTASAFTFDGSTPVVIEFFAMAGTCPASGQLLFNLYDGSTDFGRLGQVITPSAAATVVPPYLRRRLVPTAASHTFSIRAWVTTGTGSVTAGAGGTATPLPGFIRISKA